MSHITFSKMHGLGNDFVVLDTISQSLNLDNIPIKTLADRHTGIGFDQLLLLQASHQADFSCRIFNSDGSEAEQCGNGMRCIALYIHEKQLSAKKMLRIETKAGLIEISLNDRDAIQVNMGPPQITGFKSMRLDNQSLNLFVLALGNPHAILTVPSLNNTSFADLGAKISMDLVLFPQGTNVGFMEVNNPRHIRLRTFERGAGITLACGSNACAAVVAGILNNSLESKVTVELAKGNLEIEWLGEKNPVFMRGPARYLFEGTWLI